MVLILEGLLYILLVEPERGVHNNVIYATLTQQN